MTQCACCERDITTLIFEGLNNDSVCFQCRCSVVFDGGPYKSVMDNYELIAKIENYIRKYKGVKDDTTH